MRDSGRARVLEVGWYRGATRSWATRQTRTAPVTVTTTAMRRRDAATVVAEALFSVGGSPVARWGRVQAKGQVLSVWVSQKGDS